MIAHELEKLRGTDFMQMSVDLEAMFDSIWCKKPQSRWDAAMHLLLTLVVHLVLTLIASDAASGCSQPFHGGSQL
jgi:hypothetical protein